ncbi:hypothetical protein BS47DRAFT_1353141, partial [Hydnum rufescens UP504]
MADQLKPPRLFDENLQGIHKPTCLQSCRLGHSERLPESKLSTYTRTDPKHDVRAHLLLCAISLQVWSHLHAQSNRHHLKSSHTILTKHNE